MPLPKEGTNAPAFSSVDDTGVKIKLADFKGHWVVLFFYPVP